MCGTDPYESKTILFTDWIMPGIQNGQKAIFLLPRRTGGVAYAEKNGGLWLDIQPGTDLPVVLAIARVIVENGWEDADWIKNWVNSKWESSSGFGQGTRNTPWQWRTTWGKFQTDGFEDWKKWLWRRTTPCRRKPPKSPRSTSRRSTWRPNGWPSPRRTVRGRRRRS